MISLFIEKLTIFVQEEKGQAEGENSPAAEAGGNDAGGNGGGGGGDGGGDGGGGGGE